MSSRHITKLNSQSTLFLTKEFQNERLAAGNVVTVRFFREPVAHVLQRPHSYVAKLLFDILYIENLAVLDIDT